jgi:multidrug resistance protein
MDVEFATSKIVATLGLSMFVLGRSPYLRETTRRQWTNRVYVYLGIAWGHFWSPLAEFYGRRPIYLCSFLAYLIWLIPSAVAKNIETMIIARFFQGLSGSAFLSVSGGTVGDLFVRKEMQAPMAVFTLAPFIGPALGPAIGGFLNLASWRWTQYFLLIVAGTLLVAIVLFVPETYRMFIFHV